ncbi:MAG TPA: nucleotidyltransferase domain-containing protein [Thermoanaerobaculia bacterium]|nr:nucleotidyltransferase domain-containing protein [Thermoanaerobaculia bacterium]
MERAVVELASRLKDSHEEIVRVIWFGSRVRGEARAGSDVDLCLVLRHAGGRWFDRIPRYLPSHFPTDIDLFPYTEQELELLASNRPEFYAEIISGREL